MGLFGNPFSEATAEIKRTRLCVEAVTERIQKQDALIERLRAALNAASLYINASPYELEEAGITREDALERFHELHGPIYLDDEQGAK